jgi:hypothetical protein
MTITGSRKEHMTYKEMIQKRNELCQQRDAIQKEITDMWSVMQATFIEELKAFGIFQELWKYVEDPSAYSTKSFMLYLVNRDVVKKANELAKSYDLRSITVDGVHFGFYGESLQLSFDRKSDPAKFVKENNILVDFSHLDEKIGELEKKRRELIRS